MPPNFSLLETLTERDNAACFSLFVSHFLSIRMTWCWRWSWSYSFLSLLAHYTKSFVPGNISTGVDLVLICRSCIAGDDFNIILGLSNHCLKLVSWHGEVNSIYYSQQTMCSTKIIRLFTQKERVKQCLGAFLNSDVDVTYWLHSFGTSSMLKLLGITSVK